MAGRFDADVLANDHETVPALLDSGHRRSSR
jgi:hypothetical protein